MNSSFSVDHFRRVTCGDREYLESRLFHSPVQSCEFTFSNLLNWGDIYQTCWQDYCGLICIWLKAVDYLLIAEAPGDLTPELGFEISEAMRAGHFQGVLDHVREETIRRGYFQDRFTVSRMTDYYGEYFYTPKTLADLHGKKLSPKRNLIAQFKRQYPDFRVERLTAANIERASKLYERWYTAYPGNPAPSLVNESAALRHIFQNYPNSGLEGLAIVWEDELIAFSMFSQTSERVWDISFLKADRSYKGLSVMMISETARSLLGKGDWINMEQDLGNPQLRQMKRSFSPDRILLNYRLVPKNLDAD